MPPNACCTAVDPIQSMAASAKLRRSPPAFGHPFTQSFEKAQHLAPASFICPAPARQVELVFFMPPAPSALSPIRIHVRSPSGHCAHLRLTPSAPSSSFCARIDGQKCGHGEWTMRVMGKGGEEEERKEEQIVRLDGVGSIHFWAHPNGRLELKERQFLRMPATTFCPLAAHTRRTS